MPEISAALRRVAEEYSGAQQEVFANHPLAQFIREGAPAAVKEIFANDRRIVCKGSAGAGNFATVPWLAIFDTLETSTATKGIYVVFLRALSGDLYLSINQGITGVRREFGNLARDVLADRAAIIRARLPEYMDLLPIKKIDLGSLHALPRDYEAGHALGLRYTANEWPSEEIITGDLFTAIKAYRALIFRGGVDPSPDTFSQDENPDRGPLSLTEVRQYRLHRRIERNPRGAAMAKLAHGFVCKACGFDFEQTYGELGKDYIEAHHLRPLSSLEENVQVELDVGEDFSVLCSNCHRMIHRMDDPSDIEGLRLLLNQNQEN